MRDADSSGLPDPPAQFFRDMELRRTRALVERDMATLEALHSPDYQLITPAGKVFTRAAYLDAIRAEPFYAEWEAGAMSLRICAQMAVIRYQARLRFPSGRELLCWHTDSYERRAPGWQAVWSQATGIAQPAGPT
ncbi:MAG TPA: nuclear transport factor 2 family protein [Roseateles sp.]|nr:nuclear transport factor 2 family protein [Roseateles sp.]